MFSFFRETCWAKIYRYMHTVDSRVKLKWKLRPEYIRTLEQKFLFFLQRSLFLSQKKIFEQQQKEQAAAAGITTLARTKFYYERSSYHFLPRVVNNSFHFQEKEKETAARAVIIRKKIQSLHSTRRSSLFQILSSLDVILFFCRGGTLAHVGVPSKKMLSEKKMWTSGLKRGCTCFAIYLRYLGTQPISRN